MANQYDDDDFDEVEDTQQDTNAPASLRKALKASERRNKEMSEQLAQLTAQVRDRSVKEVLESKGVPSKVAKFIPGDVSTPEQIDAWLNENADIFGFAKPEETAAQTTEEQENQRAYQRINATTQNANTPSRDQDMAAKIAGAKSIEELNALTGNASQRFRGR